MPVAVAIAIRYIIMAAVQLGIWSLLEKYAIPLINKAIVEVAVVFGVSRDDAQAIVANEVLIAFEKVGVFAASLRTKMPIKVAETLGFTSKGYALRKVSSTVTAKVGTTAINATTKAATTVAEATKIAEVVASSRGITIAKVKTLLTVMATVIGVPTGFFFALAQYIDFANWQGPYQRYFQNLLSHIGINPDTPMPKASVVSADIWKRIYSTIEELKPVGVSFPFSGVDKPYSRLALADLVDEIAANMAKNGISTSYKNVLGSVLPLIQLQNGERSDAQIDAIFARAGQPLSTQKSTNTTTPTVKVFTGVVSQGVVGKGLEFEARPDDIIESAEELRVAAANNLAPYLTSIFNRIVYEVKVVSSVITKDGFKLRGMTQRIQSGTYTNGQPKYKTVTNKFATLTIYALTDKGSRAKLSTIVLGPTDSAKLQVSSNDLTTLENELNSILITKDVKDIIGVQTQNGLVSTGTVEEPAPVVAPNITSVQGLEKYGIKIYWRNSYYGTSTVPVKDLYAVYNGINRRIIDPQALIGLGIKDTEITNIGDPSMENLERYGLFTPTGGGDIRLNTLILQATQDYNTNLERAIIDAGGTVGPNAEPTKVASVSDTVPAVSSTAKKSITTLSEWYQTQGQNMPSIGIRGQTYQGLGLGQSIYYTGTAEQNTKLLNALKSGTNVPPPSASAYRGYINNGALGVL